MSNHNSSHNSTTPTIPAAIPTTPTTTPTTAPTTSLSGEQPYQGDMFQHYTPPTKSPIPLP